MAYLEDKQLTEIDKTTFPPKPHYPGSFKFVGIDFTTYIEYNGEPNRFQCLDGEAVPTIGERYKIVSMGSGDDPKSPHDSVGFHYMYKGKDYLANCQLTDDSKLFKKQLILEKEDLMYKATINAEKMFNEACRNKLLKNLEAIPYPKKMRKIMEDNINRGYNIINVQLDDEWESYSFDLLLKAIEEDKRGGNKNGTRV